MDETTGQGTPATGHDFLRHLQEAIRQNVIGDHNQGEEVNVKSSSSGHNQGVAVSIYACAQVSSPYKCKTLLYEAITDRLPSLLRVDTDSMGYGKTMCRVLKLRCFVSSGEVR